MEPTQMICPSGEKNNTPENFYSADKISQWMFERVKPYIKGRVLEFGCGSGDLASLCLQHEVKMYVNDSNETQQNVLKQRFTGEPRFGGITSIDPSDNDFDLRYSHFLEVFDTIIALNIMAPTTKESLSVSNYNKLLRKGGFLSMVIPANTALYNGIEQGLKDWYNHNLQLLNKLLLFECEIVKIRYFNIFHMNSLGEQQGYTNKYISSFCVKDDSASLPEGLSIIAVIRKKGLLN